MNAILALSGVVIKELYRRKDFYVLFILTVLLTLMMAFANLFNDERIVGYLKEGCLLLIWICTLVIAVGTAARQIPSEKENRTIFPLLAKPVTRAQVVAGKFLGCWLASGIALLTFYLFLMVISASREHEWRVPVYFQAMWMQWMFLAIVTAMALLGSIVFAAPSSNATICLIVTLAILVLGRHLNKVAVEQAEPARSFVYAIYYLIPHMEYYDLREFVVFHRLAPWWACGVASVYALGYAGFFLFAAWLSFRRKALTT